MKKALSLALVLFVTVAFAFQSDTEIRRIDGKDFRVYKVEKGDTWYSIARKFEISYSELRVANKNTNDKIVTEQELLIPAKLQPTDPYFEKNHTDVKPETKKEIPVDKFHEVKPSQTLFSIAKMYGISVDQLKLWNNLASNSISVGQKLLVSKSESAPKAGEKKEIIQPVVTEENNVSPPVIIEESKKPVETTSEIQKEQKDKESTNEKPAIDTSQVTSKIEDMPPPAAETKLVEQPTVVTNEKAEKSDEVVFANGRQQVNETGNATWMNGDDDNSDKYYALHRTAKIGTVIRVMNLSNSRKIYVKVTGQLNDEDSGILIKLSKASAEKLGISEKTARVNLLYGTGEE